MQPIYYWIIGTTIFIIVVGTVLYKLLGFRFIEFNIFGLTFGRTPTDDPLPAPPLPVDKTKIIHKTKTDGDVVYGDKPVGDKVLRDKITIGTIVIPPDSREKDAIHLPAITALFTGREEHLTAIAAHFADDSGTVLLTQTISGLGGVGKTQVALAYAHVYRSRYDIVWVLQADDSVALTDSLRRLGLALGLGVAELDAEGVRSTLLSHLGTSKRDVLLIYDNADAIEPRDLYRYLPNNCHLLITSRRAAAQWGGVTTRAVRLGVFSKEEAAAFWRRWLDDDTEDTTTEDRLLERMALAEELGYLPLAMGQAAATMKMLGLDAADYLQSFRTKRDELWQGEKPPVGYHDELTVATTWEIGFEHAKETKGAADLLNLCCFFAPDDIPLQVITDGAERLPEPLATVAADKLTFKKAVAALSDYSLLTLNGNETVSVHRLVQLVARGRMEAEGRLWVEAAMKLLSRAWPFDQYDMDTWKDCSPLLPHLMGVTAFAEQYEVETARAASLNSHLDFYLDFFGDKRGALPFSKRALAIKEKLLANDPDNEELEKSVALSANNMGSLLQAMGKLEEARPFYDQALAIKKKALGENHPSLATSYNNMGGLLKAMGKLEEARPFFDQALAIDKKALGEDHPDAAQSYNNMGGVLQAMGKLEEARPFYDQALAITKKALGEEHPTTAIRYNNMGSLLQDMGKLEEARPFLDQALAITKKALGENHPNIAYGYNNMASLLEAMEDYAGAAPYYERALAIFEASLGAEHPNSKVVRNNLMLLKRKMGAAQA